MGTVGVVVGLVVPEEPQEMSTAHHQHEVEQLGPSGADEALCEGVGLR